MLEEHSSDKSYPQIIDIVIPAYNARHIIENSVKSTLKQLLPANWYKNIIIVDDGSTDGTDQQCRTFFNEQVQVVIHEKNRGRAASRNTGWRSGSGRYVVFLDADCEWSFTGTLAAHLERLEAGMDVSTGAIVAHDQSFWATYQNRLQSSREKDFSSGNYAAFTSANFAIRRSLLEATGGFDEGYHHYGFEDRDFFLRLISTGCNVVYCPEAAVTHMPTPSLKDICQKMQEAGEFSSSRFQSSHPEYYKQSSYGRFDCRINGFPLKTLAAVSEPLLQPLAGFGDKVIRLAGVPFKVKCVWVKIISGFAYLAGTYRGFKRREQL